jgi:branched-chain amino acid transport system substrate-binding protein
LIIPIILIGCAKKEKEPYKVGAVFAITGGASFLGEPERNTVKMMEEEINAAGGIKGNPLELIVYDTEGDPTKTVNAVNKLINMDKVAAIIGPTRSGSTMAVVPIVEEAKIPLVSCAAAEAIVTDPDTGKERYWTFKTPQKDSHAVIRIYEHMKSKGISKVALITGTTGFGDQGRKQLKKYAAEMGFSIVADETYAPADTDMTAQLTKIKETDAQAVINWSIVDGQSIVPKNMLQLNMTIPLYQSHGFGNVKYIEKAGNEAAEGIICPVGRLLVAEQLPDDHPQKDLLVKYKTAYEEKYNEYVSTFGGHAYDSLQLVVKALEEVGSEVKEEGVNVALRPKIRDAIEKTTNFAGTGGIFNFSPDDHNGLTKAAFDMMTVKDGKFVSLEDYGK